MVFEVDSVQQVQGVFVDRQLDMVGLHSHQADEGLTQLGKQVLAEIESCGLRCTRSIARLEAEDQDIEEQRALVNRMLVEEEGHLACERVGQEDLLVCVLEVVVL